MSEVATEARRPGRPRKEEVTQTERRRRKGGTATSKLAIPDEVIAANPDMEFRWGSDTEGRMQQLTQNDDWDKVPKVRPIHGGADKAGNSIKQHLLMKPKKFMDEDRAEKMARIKDMEQNTLAKPTAEQAIAQGAEQYAVAGNKI